jgi:hypothetical protein
MTLLDRDREMHSRALQFIPSPSRRSPHENPAGGDVPFMRLCASKKEGRKKEESNRLSF